MTDHTEMIEAIKQALCQQSPFDDDRPEDYEAEAQAAINAIAPIYEARIAALEAQLAEREPTEAMVDDLISQRIERMGWAEIKAFQIALQDGQGVCEDAGGFMLRAIKSLLGIKARPSDPIFTYRTAIRAMQEARDGTR